MAGRGPFSITGTDMNSPMTVTNPAAPRPQLDHQMPPISYNDDNSTAVFGQMGSTPMKFQSVPNSNAVINHLGMSDNSDQRRKRGRPRKYAPESGSTIPAASAQPPPFSPQEGGATAPAKRPRGRPRGSCNKKPRKESLGSTGTGFRPHVINVIAGEDVSSKLVALFQKDGSRGVCVLSAIGAVSSVSLYQAASSGAAATYEGQFDILSLRGSFLLSETGGHKNRTGGLSVLLSGSDGRVLGGCVAGSLIAATPVQVIAGSFLPEVNRDAKANTSEAITAPLNMNLSSADGDGVGSSSPSGGSPSGSSGGPESPLNF